ncbi:CHASE2 domain-containing protein [Thermomonas aquatica]|uniref:CHASE2 domain-containing protein n=1 Tax=Thermomonas aquatica TaxID=2202149 RepID=A0A5B7ZT81_9GAMM|nr:CHASE2 domain-containing protein [Thermomonas aquatica]QDA58148.1 CHASE2 domain-containing protein [Thermomonas aquatica]
MARKLVKTLQDRIDAAMASLAVWFMDAWTIVERSWRRPLSRLALRLKYAFYPLLACAALGWLGWDWTHQRSLDAAENSIFDTVIQWRPIEPRPSGKTVVVEIDDCSIDYFSNRGQGGWPWPRQRHADLLDMLDRAGVRAAGIDVLFLDALREDPDGDAVLDAMASGGDGRFVFASKRQDPAFDADAPLRASQLPGAFRNDANAQAPGPRVMVLLPYGEAMAKHSALTNVSRGQDGVLRDVPLSEDVGGGWSLPTLPLRLAMLLQRRPGSAYPAEIRVNWREHSRMPYVSAANLLEGKQVCVDKAGEKRPDLKDAVVLVGYTASGISDSKPTPVNPAMPGVEVWAEATDALLHAGGIKVPPTSFKYLLAALLVMLTTYAFWRGEPHEDVDPIFVAINIALLAAAFVGLTYFGAFLDIFASIGFVSLCFGFCRLYSGVQRGRAVGNNDYRDEYDPRRHPWLVMARLRFIANPELDAFAAVRGKREYRRLLRRQLYAGGEAVMIEGIVERKSWLHEILDDLIVLVWEGTDEAAAMALAKRELDQLFASLNDGDLPLDAHGRVMICVSAAEIDDDNDDSVRGERVRLRELLGRDLNATDEWPLTADNRVYDATRPGATIAQTGNRGDTGCETPTD